jgi:hypothetical protein
MSDERLGAAASGEIFPSDRADERDAPGEERDAPSPRGSIEDREMAS